MSDICNNLFAQFNVDFVLDGQLLSSESKREILQSHVFQEKLEHTKVNF